MILTVAYVSLIYKGYVSHDLNSDLTFNEPDCTFIVFPLVRDSFLIVFKNLNLFINMSKHLHVCRLHAT